jgi:signal transduction histidine kinase
VANIELGKIVLHKKETNVSDLVQDSCFSHSLVIKEKNLQLTQNIAPSISASVDPLRFNQILINLLTNALKFSYAGGEIIVTLKQQLNSLHLSIEDSGIGIAAEKIDTIFNPFEQVDMTFTRSRGGVGLGLTITKRLVELHEGTIAVTSTIGKGSIFTVILPIT